MNLFTKSWIKTNHPTIKLKYFCFECGEQEGGGLIDLVAGQYESGDRKHECGQKGHKKMWQACSMCQCVWSLSYLSKNKRRGLCEACFNEESVTEEGVQELEPQIEPEGEGEGVTELEPLPQPYTLRKDGFRFIKHHLKGHSCCLDTAKTFVEDLLARCPLDKWSHISGGYRQTLLMTAGKWVLSIQDVYGVEFLRKFELQLKNMLVCIFLFVVVCCCLLTFLLHPFFGFFM